MRLVVSTPTEIVADIPDIRQVLAEDDTGGFGIRPGHADFVTVLPVSIVTWRDAAREGFVVLRGGVLCVRGGDLVEIAARGAWSQDQLAALGETALQALRRATAEEDVTRRSEQRLHLATVRKIEELLRGGRDGVAGAPRLEARTPTAAEGDIG